MYKKKSLGQHFLNSPHYLALVADALNLKAGEVVLEIGPGEGALTHALLERGAHVIALEKDARLIPVLKEKFKDSSLEVIEGDALDYEPPTKNYKLVGNIPYYITGALFKKFLTTTHQPETLVFLVQKEVAERIARSKKESILSLSVKAYGEPRYVKTVPAGAFVPAPKVDSAILVVERVSRSNFKDREHEERFFTLLHNGFGQKRKLLMRNLEATLPPTYIKERFLELGIPPNARAEDVPLAQWLKLSEH